MTLCNIRDSLSEGECRGCQEAGESKCKCFREWDVDKRENVGGVSQSDKARYEPDLFLTFQRWIAVALPQSVNDLPN